MFASWMRWRGMDPSAVPDEIPHAFTLSALDDAKVDEALVSAWRGPRGPLRSNDHVAAIVRANPSRLAGVASTRSASPTRRALFLGQNAARVFEL